MSYAGDNIQEKKYENKSRQKWHLDKVEFKEKGGDSSCWKGDKILYLGWSV